MGVLAVGFATAFDGLVGGYFAQDQGPACLMEMIVPICLPL
jgi:hypothetical protein